MEWIPELVHTTRIIKELGELESKDFLKSMRKNLIVGPHALDHLSHAQRQLSFEDELLKFSIRHKPLQIALQDNDYYSLVYNLGKKKRRIIVAKKLDRYEIITFINIKAVPRIEPNV